jgi:serine/threonine protein kinase
MINKKQFLKYKNGKSELLGSGGFGKVYKVVTSDKPHQIYAMKVIDIANVTEKYMLESPMVKTPIRQENSKDLMEMKHAIWKSLFNEAKIMEKLHDKNIIKMFYYFIDDDLIKGPKHLYILMEYSSYGTLLKYIKSQPKKRINEFITRGITANIVNGLVYLANHSIIHGDLKASNILIFPNGDIKLCDFGLSFQWDDSNKYDYNDTISNNCSANSKLQKIATNGSAYWLAPEIIIHRMATPKSDVWSLGATVIEMLTGNPPFSDYGPLPACHAVGSGSKIIYPKNINFECKEFLNLCFQYDPILRPRAKMLLKTKWIKHAKKNVLHNVEEITELGKVDNDFDDFGNKFPDKKTLDDYKENAEDASFKDVEFKENTYDDMHSKTLIQLKQLQPTSNLSDNYTSSFVQLLKKHETAKCEEMLRIGQYYLKMHPNDIEKLCFNGMLVCFGVSLKSGTLCGSTIKILWGVLDALGNRGREWLIVTGFPPCPCN